MFFELILFKTFLVPLEKNFLFHRSSNFIKQPEWHSLLHLRNFPGGSRACLQLYELVCPCPRQPQGQIFKTSSNYSPLANFYFKAYQKKELFLRKYTLNPVHWYNYSCTIVTMSFIYYNT